MYKIKRLSTIDGTFKVLSNVEIGQWCKENLNLPDVLFSENIDNQFNINVCDIVFRNIEEVNLFKLYFIDEYIAEIEEYENS